MSATTSPLLVDMQPAGRFLGESFHRAGGVPGVMRELLAAGSCTATSSPSPARRSRKILKDVPEPDREVIRAYGNPLKAQAGFAVLSGNLFDSAVMKTSVISPEFRARYLQKNDDPMAFEGTAIVFEGPEDYHARINDPSLPIDEHAMLFIRNVGPVGYPGSAEVVNMLPPDRLGEAGHHAAALHRRRPPERHFAEPCDPQRQSRSRNRRRARAAADRRPRAHRHRPPHRRHADLASRA